MIQIGLLAIVIILFLIYVVRPKRLHKLTLGCAWMLSIFFEDMFYTIFSLNLEWIDVSDRAEHVWVRVLGMYVATPLMLVWTLDATAAAANARSRLTVLAAGAASLLAIDASLDLEGVWLVPNDWPIWGWAAKPLSLIAIVAVFVERFRRLLRSEGIAG